MKDAQSAMKWKVGVTVILSAVALGVLLFLTGSYHLGEDGYNLNVIFNYARGIEVGAPVLVSGVKLGTVEDVDFIYRDNHSRVRLKLWVLKKAVIKQDAKVFIKSLGLLGQSALEIITGSESAAPVEKNATLEGEEPFVTEEILAQARDVAEGLSKSVSLFNSILEDARAKENIRIMLQNMAAASGEFQRSIRGNAARIDAIAQSVEKTAVRVEGVSDGVTKDLAATMQNLRVASEELHTLIQKNRPKMDETVEGLRRSSDSLEKSMKDLRVFTEKLASAKGAVGVLTSDEQTAKQVRNAVTNLEQFSLDIRNNPWKLLRKP